ncbi:hypothetical protein M409DRAFT_15710 [Zasmidium cellare ATCC 36951]|uniref:Glycosyl transferase CAP10 domain-containing protein n=1 Tax=Zasmidium cellare ATCC 36951 TaxID=1080233 RepID=A0A6A6D2L1_ZASCE|nr:uncharacterized protein M409DRAFT_15710 [Zasmidium cellare ATCC 36951]KAF2173425.1 hypothetical protein M409DRAFT_15710 [Zasmidium cellare ATCC 36951]
MAITGNREPWLSWRRACFLLTGILFLTLLINALPHKASIPLLRSPGHSSSKPTTSSYHFGSAAADNEAIDGLTDAQCAAEFPDLYADIDRAVAYWKQKSHTITAKDIEISHSRAAIRILIHENELRILESKQSVDPMRAAPDRALGVLHLIQRALDASMAAGERLPTVEVVLNFQDDADPGESHSFWTFARHVTKETHQRLWLMPNFDFWYYEHTGTFIDAKRDAMQRDAAFTSKIPQIVWRGNPDFNPELRGSLISVSKGKDWADIASVHEIESWFDVDEFCKYAMTVYTEGVTYSGRLKFLMNCQSLLFAHEPAYETHYSHLLVKEGPQQNYVFVKRDWSDLEDKVIWYLEHPDEAEKVIANSLETFRSRYITRAATSCYIRRLIQGYGEVAWTPDVHVPMKDGEGVRLRGYGYEKFMDKPADANFEEME